MVAVILVILTAWLVLSCLTAVVFAAVGRGGHVEDRVRGYDRP
jgi:hypothetical protein